MTKKKTTSKKPKGKKKKAKPKARAKRKKQPPLTKAEVKAWGFSCETMTEAAVLYTKGNLPGRLARSKALRDAWDQGRFLRSISQFARYGMTKAEVAVKLEIELVVFEDMLNEPEACDIWTRAQIDALATLKGGIFQGAIDGKGPALKAYELILQNDRPSAAIDIFRMTEKQMLAITEVTRQTLNTWRVVKGLSRNSDGTYDLRVFFKWFERFSQGKVNVSPKVAGADSLRDLKAERLKDEIDLERGKMVPRDSVITGYVGRLQQMLTIWDRLADGVADKCAPLPKQGCAEILEKFKDQLCSELCKVDVEMKLTESEHTELEKFLEKLK